MSRQAKTRQAAARPANRLLKCESLEKRELMAGIVFNSGIVTIQGTNQRDIGTVSASGTLLRVTLAGPTSQTRDFHTSQVRQVVFHGYAGNDEFHNNTNVPSKAYGGDGDDYLKGGGGSDLLSGQGGNDTVLGYAGNDTLYGGAGNDSLNGGEGNDTLYGGDGHDNLRGHTGHDTIYGDAGNDFIDGGDGNDYLSGGTGNDTIYGGMGADRLFGNEGNDYLDGGNDGSVDSMTGGSGSDTFIIENYISSGTRKRRDRVLDFYSSQSDRYSDRL